MNDQPALYESKRPRRFRFGLKTLLLFTAVVAITIFIVTPILTNSGYADLVLKHQVVTADRQIQITFDTTMASDSYVSLTCEKPTIAADQPKTTVPGWPDRREYYYIAQFNPYDISPDVETLTSGFSLRVGDKVRLDRYNPSVEIFRHDINGKPYTMTLKFTHRRS